MASVLFDNHTFLVAAAKYARVHSQDEGTLNGAIVVNADRLAVGLGANHYLNSSWRSRATDRAKKLTLIEHAERASILKASRRGHSLVGGSMFCVWAACPECARAIVGSGITMLVTLQKTRDLTPERWAPQIAEADQMLREAGVLVSFYDKPIGVSLMFNGKMVDL